HDIQSVSAFGVNRFIKTDRTLDGIQGINDHFFFDAYLFGNFHYGGFLGMLTDILFFGIDCLVGYIPERTADPDGIIVPQVTAYLTDDHGNGISRKFYVQGSIKIVNGFDQADAADLKQIIRIFVASGETFDHAEYQP